MERACTTNGEKRNACRILVGKPEGNRPLGRPRRRSHPSFPSALQLRVIFGLLDNLPPFFRPSEAECLVSEQFSFYGVRLLASRPTPNLQDQGIPLDLSGMGDYQ
jgi:hypothetical protein